MINISKQYFELYFIMDLMQYSTNYICMQRYMNLSMCENKNSKHCEQKH